MRRTVHGVDFSGAVDAGKRIWIASGEVDGRVLRIEACRRGDTLPGSGVERERCLDALRRFVAANRSAVFGLDFPFGLPRAVCPGDRWEDVADRFVDRQPDPGAFRRACVRATAGAEHRRHTDVDARTPFSPYNLRVYRQTFYGITRLLLPLVRDSVARVLPMQSPEPDCAWLIEICPASTLKALGLYAPYKERGLRERSTRQRILEQLERDGALVLSRGVDRLAVVEDLAGDALDSILGAYGTFRGFSRREGQGAMNRVEDALEGHVYF